MDGLGFDDEGLGLFEDGMVERLLALHATVDTLLEFSELLCYGGVEGNHSRGAVGRRTHGAELKTVSGEGKRRCAVAVGVVKQDFRNLGDSDSDAFLACQLDQFILCAFFETVKDVGNLRTGEYGDDGWRRLIRTKTVGIGGGGDGGFQQRVVFVHGCHDIGHKSDEAQVLPGGLAGGEQQGACVGAEAPVVVLS